MRNRLIDLILCLLPILFLVPCPVPSAWVEVADPTKLSTEGAVGLAERLESSGRDGGGYVTDVLNEIGTVNVGPEGTGRTLAALQTEAGILAELHTGGCLDDFAERTQEGARIL